MQTTFKLLTITRNNIKVIIDSLSLEQLNTKPSNFNNTIAWQLGHIIVTQQLLCYAMSDNAPIISETLIDKYRKGSQSGIISQKELGELLALLETTNMQLAYDYNNNLFKAYTTYETSFGFTLTNIEEAIQMNAVHEGLHLGNIMALQKLV